MKGRTPNKIKGSFLMTANPTLKMEIARKRGSIINNFWNATNTPLFDLSDCQVKSLSHSSNSPKYNALAGQISGIKITGIDQILRYFKFCLFIEKIKNATNGMNKNAGTFVKIANPKNIPEKIEIINFSLDKNLPSVALVDCLLRYNANNIDNNINGNWIGSSQTRLRIHVKGTTAKIAADKRPTLLLYLICAIL